ncbi:hypothetical protein [Dysgonomonas termitidis]|uniref:YopX protein domain-containing protein n=1 Tax=Dysgonomonas termitidis TaxID=1516126 RepID=A0ABV9KTC6_9BACT
MEELNLLDYLIPDIEIYSVIHQNKKTVLRIEPDNEFPIVIGNKKKGYRPMRFNTKGSVLKGGTDCLLFPSEDVTTWEGYVTPLKFEKGDIVKAITDEGKMLIAIYSHFDKDSGAHYCHHSVAPDGNIEFMKYSQVDKFRKDEGYLYAKRIYSKMSIAKIEKQSQTQDTTEKT